MTEGSFPCSAIVLEGLSKMEVSPSLVGRRLGLDEVVVGVLVGSRRRCRTSKGKDALIALGEDAEVVVLAHLTLVWISPTRPVRLYGEDPLRIQDLLQRRRSPGISRPPPGEDYLYHRC